MNAFTARAEILTQVGTAFWRGAELQLVGLTLAEGTDGALVNYGKASLRSVVIIDHMTRTAPAIISNDGELSLTHCELSHNTISNAAQNAGTIINYGFLEVRDTHMHGNTVSRRFQSLVLAFALLNYGKAELSIVGLSDNEAVAGFPALTYSGAAQAFINEGTGTMTIKDVIAANNFPQESY